jgi:hypothetical protein
MFGSTNHPAGHLHAGGILRSLKTLDGLVIQSLLQPFARFVVAT